MFVGRKHPAWATPQDPVSKKKKKKRKEKQKKAKQKEKKRGRRGWWVTPGL